MLTTEMPRIGVYVCWCGTNIAKMVDVVRVSDEINKLPNVVISRGRSRSFINGELDGKPLDIVISRDYKYMCSDPGQELIIEDIKELGLNRIVVGACSPRMHELTFRKALEKAGINPYNLEVANIREQVSWVHTDREQATQKAIDLIRAAVHRVGHHESLDKRTVEINPASLVIGGGIAGLSTALEIADAGKKVFLVEKDDQLGGHVRHVDQTFPYMNSGKQMLNPLIAKVNDHPNVEVFLQSGVKEVFGYIGNFEIQLATNGKETEVKAGNIVVATGLKPFNPEGIEEYGYGKLPDVVTSLEFEKMMAQGKVLTKDGKEPENVAIIHCVGSRDTRNHEYCSRTCCMTALKFANQTRSILPKANVYQLYSDIRAFSKGCEEFYKRTARDNVMFLAFEKEELPKIKKAGAGDNCNMLIEMDEVLSGESIQVPADMVVLMVAMEAREDSRDIGHLVGISSCGNDFYIEKHPKLDPVATTTAGVYIVGACAGPKDIPDSVVQGKAAAARILATIEQKSVEVEVTTAEVNEDTCCGCQTCVTVCPYTAISFDEEKGVSVVNEVLCKGCGTCGSACPMGAIRSKHFTDEQIISQIEGLFAMEVS